LAPITWSVLIVHRWTEKAREMMLLFGLATRARLHVTVADDTTAPPARTAVRTRADPRLKAV
jgi:hypothetical protein